MMVASSQEQVQAVQQSRDLPGLAGFDHELRTAARRRRQAPTQLTLPTGGASMACFCPDMPYIQCSLLLLKECSLDAAAFKFVT